MNTNDLVYFKRAAGWCQGRVTAVDDEIVHVTACLSDSSYTFNVNALTTREQYKKILEERRAQLDYLKLKYSSIKQPK